MLSQQSLTGGVPMSDAKNLIDLAGGWYLNGPSSPAVTRNGHCVKAARPARWSIGSTSALSLRRFSRCTRPTAPLAA